MSVHDRGRKSSGKRWEVRWRDGRGVQHSRRVTTKDEAMVLDSRQRVSPSVDSRRTVADEYERWIATKAGLSSESDYRAHWRLRVEPVFGHRALASIRHDEIAGWLAGLECSPSTVRRSFVTLSGILRQAARSGAIPADPSAGVRLPRDPHREMVALSPEQVSALADACAPHRMVVWTLALTGIRWGEMVALDPSDLDRDRRRLRVSKSVTDRGGHPVTKGTKTGRARDVPVTPWLLANLELPLLTSRGNRWRHSSWRRVWLAACAETGISARVHDLRHTAASWAIQSGADVKAVQRMMGHASATMTLDRYGHLWDRGLDDLGVRLDRFGPGA